MVFQKPKMSLVITSEIWLLIVWSINPTGYQIFLDALLPPSSSLYHLYMNAKALILHQLIHSLFLVIMQLLLPPGVVSVQTFRGCWSKLNNRHIANQMSLFTPWKHAGRGSKLRTGFNLTSPSKLVRTNINDETDKGNLYAKTFTVLSSWPSFHLYIMPCILHRCCSVS